MDIKFENIASTCAKVVVVGIGGAGGNALNRIINSGIKDVNLVAINTDVQDLTKSLCPLKIQIGEKITRGLGAGSNPELGKKSAEESIDAIKEIISGADMVFITAGMGGGTGTGASPVVAKIAKDQGALTLAIVTKPFTAEGRRKIQQAQDGIKELKKFCDSVIVISNDKIFELYSKDILLEEAFYNADEILREGVQAVTELTTKKGYINVDFADIRTIMENKGEALLGIGYGTGEKMGIDAIEKALHSPLLDNKDIKDAKGILLCIYAHQIKVGDYQSILVRANQLGTPDTLIIPGLINDQQYQDKIKVLIIATGFEDGKKKKPLGDTITFSDFMRHQNNLFDTIEEPNQEQPCEISIETEIKNENPEDPFEIPSFLKRKLN